MANRSLTLKPRHSSNTVLQPISGQGVTRFQAALLPALLLAALGFGGIAAAAPGPAPAGDPGAADAVSQAVGKQDAASSAGAAQAAFAAALASGQDPHPDQGAWSAAYLAAESAVAAARSSGDSPALRDALAHSARVYTMIGWYSRAFAAYDEFVADGGELLAEPVPSPLGGRPLLSDLDGFVMSTNQLGFARYQAGDMDGASAYYLAVLDIKADEPEALRWLGRIAFERGDVEGARVAAIYFGRLLELDPQDESASYFLDLSRERQAIGVGASELFRAAIGLYESGDVSGAFERFEAAAEAAPDFIDAAVWAGRTALELDLPELAVRHWERVVEARPDDQGATWFLGLARTQLRWGTAAGRAYYDGLAAYEVGDLETAVESFVAATQANPEFVGAWVWAARSLQEDARPLASIPYWERVLELDPDDERARWYLTRAGTAEEHGEIAGPAYYDAAARYQAGDIDGALALLEEALAAEPNFSEAWGLKGRIAFQQRRFDVAAEAYATAAELEPDNDDYAFFAREAKLLSEPEEGP